MGWSKRRELATKFTKLHKMLDVPSRDLHFLPSGKGELGCDEQEDYCSEISEWPSGFGGFSQAGGEGGGDDGDGAEANDGCGGEESAQQDELLCEGFRLVDELRQEGQEEEDDFGVEDVHEDGLEVDVGEGDFWKGGFIGLVECDGIFGEDHAEGEVDEIENPGETDEEEGARGGLEEGGEAQGGGGGVGDEAGREAEGGDDSGGATLGDGPGKDGEDVGAGR